MPYSPTLAGIRLVVGQNKSKLLELISSHPATAGM